MVPGGGGDGVRESWQDELELKWGCLMAKVNADSTSHMVNGSGTNQSRAFAIQMKPLKTFANRLFRAILYEECLQMVKDTGSHTYRTYVLDMLEVPERSRL